MICAATHSPDPVVRREWVKDGALVTSVGVHPSGGEVDPALFRAARIVVESRASAFASPPAGAFELRGLDPAQAAELGERPARRSNEEIILYKSVGVAAEDAAAAALVLSRTRSTPAPR